jgi:tRNA threonylcarbamoyladenosine biosynthesis protein TsaB
MIEPVMKRYASKQFEDVAYFEPFYLKDFIATTPRKKVI